MASGGVTRQFFRKLLTRERIAVGAHPALFCAGTHHYCDQRANRLIVMKIRFSGMIGSEMPPVL
jgi:hypothetical protein